MILWWLRYCYDFYTHEMSSNGFRVHNTVVQYKEEQYSAAQYSKVWNSTV